MSLSVLFHPRDDYTSLAAFAELAAVVRPDVTVATHPWGRYRFERPRADRIDEELGFSLRLIEPALFREDAPETDRPALPVLTPGPEPARRDTIVVGHRRPEAHPADGALIERVVRAVLRDRADVEWRPEADTCDVYIDHLDTDFGGYTAAGLDALAHGAVCLAAATRVGPHVEAFWPRPPVIVVEDAAALGRALAALLEDRKALYAARLASWRWARDVASEAPATKRLNAWLEEAMPIAAARRDPAPLWRPTDEPRVACAVIARATDQLSQASLRAALRSVASLTDECVVVLDERSSAETDAMLEALGVRVVRRAWTDDFAAARNHVHEHVRAEWLVCIDADEVLVRAGDLASAIANADRDGHQAVLARVETVGDDGIGERLWQFRAYRRRACRWRYAVHNELVGVESVVPTTALFHASYVGTASDKASRSLPLLYAQAANEPDEPRWAHFLAQTFQAIGDTPRMVEWAQRCVAQAPDEEAFVHRWCDLALARYAGGETERALETILDATRRHPRHPDPWHVLATIALAQWHAAAGGPPTLSPIRSGRHAPHLPSVAAKLGLPLAYAAPVADRRLPERDDSRDRPSSRAGPVGHEPATAEPPPRAPSEPDGRLRIAFVCGASTSFIAGIEHALAARHHVRRLHFTERAALRDVDAAMAWADVVWFEWCDELLVEASRRLQKHARVVCRLHSYEAFTDAPTRVRWGFVDRLVFVSAHLRAIFEDRFDARPPSVVVPNAIATDHRRLSTRGDPFALAYVGYLNAKKSPPLLLQCMAALIRRDPRYHLHLAGSFQDPRYELYFDKMIPALGLQGHVTLHGWVDDVDAWLDDKSFIVSTSVLESFGVGIAEAMAKGLTPVIHDWVGAEEIWPREHTFRTVSEFADIVLRGRADPAAMRAWVAERYDLPRVVARVDALLRDVVGATAEVEIER